MFICEGLECRRLMALAGLVGGYGFEEGAGSAIGDASGNGLSGMAQNVAWVAGKFGNALSFNGNNSWVTINDSALLHLTKGMTLEAWVKPTTVTGWRTILLKQRGNALSYALYGSDPNRSPAAPAGFINTGGANDKDSWSTALLPLNAWTHLTSTYDGSALRLYVNGALVRSVATTGTIQSNSDVLRIGGNSIWGEYFSGLVDEVRVYNRALSASEIQSDMNAPVNAMPTLDTTFPSVSITAPASNAIVGRTVTLTANASDDRAVAGVQFLVDGNLFGTEDTTAPYSIVWDTTGLSGSHTISAIVRDTSSNKTTSANINVTVDNQSPTVSITAPSPASTISGTITVSATASDNSPIAGVQFYRDGVSLGAEDTIAPFSIAWNTSALTGAHLLTAVARDVAGNTTTSSAVSVTIDNADRAAPSVTMTAPAANASVSGTVTISAGASDNVAVTGVQFQLNGGALGVQDTTAPYAVSWNTTSNPNGNYLLTAVARDAAGNSMTSAAIPVHVANGVITLALNPSQRFQTIDGLGVNLGSSAWNSGAVIPQLDTLINTVGADLFRVQIEAPSGWEDTNDNADPFLADSTFYDALYTAPKFQDLWNTIKYLNDHNKPVLLNVMGYMPAWLGGTGSIPANLEDELVEMETTMLDYAVHTKGLRIDFFSAMNEQDWGHNEGPLLGTTQAGVNIYLATINKLIARMNTLGLGSIQVVGGETASNSTQYASGLLASPAAMADIYHIAFHNYDGTIGQFASFNTLAQTAGYSGRNFWVTEYASGYPLLNHEPPDEWAYAEISFQYGLSYLANGASATMVFDGIDAPYVHDDTDGTYGLIRWDIPTNTYSPRKRMYVAAQMEKFIKPGMTRIGSTLSGTGNANVIEQAFYNSITGQLAVVGENKSTGPVTLDIHLGGLPITALSLYETNASLNLQQFPDVTVTGGIATFNIPPGTIFSLGAPTAVDISPPSQPTSCSAADGYGKVTLSWSASSDDVAVNAYDIYRSTDSAFIPDPTNKIGQTSATSFIDTVVPGTYYYAIIARDQAGNQSVASALASANSVNDNIPPTVGLTTPNAGATLSGNVSLIATAADDVGLEGVFFYADGKLIGSEDTSTPYSVTWTTAGVTNGTHTLTAVARDLYGNITISAPVQVSVQNSVAVPGLIAAWGFDEGSGTTTSDHTGNGNSGVISNAVWTTGKFGGALRFNGTNAWVTVADSTELRLTNGMTLEAWVNLSAASGWSNILLKQRGSSGLSYSLYATDPNRSPAAPAAFINTGGAADKDSWGTSILGLNIWTHLAATYDGTSLKMYVNGALARSVAATGTIQEKSDALRIGGNSAWGEYFSGLIDEVRIYNRALNLSEIHTDMNSAINPAPTVTLAAINDATPLLTAQTPGDAIRRKPPTRISQFIFTAGKEILD